jgi:hypothetical protein
MEEMSEDQTGKDNTPSDPTVQLRLAEDGSWEISSNMGNPNRIIILVAANLITKMLG